MTSLAELIQNEDVVALTFRQKLQSVDEPDVPIFPPTYPVGKGESRHRYDTPYTINEDGDGLLICDLDTVQSQANRMEAAFSDDLADLVPQHAVKAGNAVVPLTALSHRVADAAIRATDLNDTIREAFRSFLAGDPLPLAKLAPTSFVFGAWDSRDTSAKVPRAIRSEIRAFDVAVLTKSALFSGSFSQPDLGLTDEEWEKAAKKGLASTPSVDAHGGILVKGDILQTASIHLGALRRFGHTAQGDLLPRYLLGLALAGLVASGRDYNLRSGCWLVLDGAPEWRTVSRSGERQAVELGDVVTEARDPASEWVKAVEVTLGGEPTIHPFDPKIGKKIAKGQA